MKTIRQLNQIMNQNNTDKDQVSRDVNTRDSQENFEPEQNVGQRVTDNPVG